MYISRETKEGVDPKAALQPYLTRFAPITLFESYYTSSASVRGTDTVTQESDVDQPRSPIVILQPYAGSETLTDGLDWEAEQGEKAFWTIMGRQDDAEDGKGFFDRTEADEPEDDEL